MAEGIDPIKLCCGQPASAHRGPQCPDGLVMCCLCFGRFQVADLFTYSGDDRPSDVCQRCGESEMALLDG